jgi:nitrite reductase/ring-hydroxylating ferredoxin subunit
MFRRKLPQGSEELADSGIEAAALQEGEMVRLKLRGESIALALVQGQLRAFTDVCPHGASRLSEGRILGDQVCCREHGYCFDLSNGRLSWPPDEPYLLRIYETSVEDGRVKILFPSR